MPEVTAFTSYLEVISCLQKVIKVNLKKFYVFLPRLPKGYMIFPFYLPSSSSHTSLYYFSEKKNNKALTYVLWGIGTFVTAVI